MLPTPEQDHLRATARRVGELIRTCPPLAARLQKAWNDYKALHLGHIEQTRLCAELQRQHAIEIMKQGFMEEQPRKEYEPSWDWESFYVRVPKHLLKARDAERDAAKRAPIIAELAAATLEYLEWHVRIKECPDKVSGKAMWDRMDAAMPDEEYVQETIRVGFRPRPAFEPGPHPLSCKWEEYQGLPLSTRVTVALAVLAILHDELSATPILAPLPQYLENVPATQLDAVVAFAVKKCLSVTQSQNGDSEPPTPNPRRISVERAEAFMNLLQSEAEALSASAVWGAEEKCPASTMGEAVEWYLEPVLAILRVFEAGVSDGDAIMVNGSLLPHRYMDALRSRYLGLLEWPQGVNYPERGNILRIAADYPKHGKRISQVLPFVTGKCSIARAAVDQWRMDVRDLQKLAGINGGSPDSQNRADDLPKDEVQFAAAEDFTWVVFAGQSYQFSKGVQANVIRALWEAWERSGKRFGHGLGEEAIGAKVDSSATKFRLAHVFRDHPAWKTLIRSVSKGVFALMPPKSPEKHTS